MNDPPRFATLDTPPCKIAGRGWGRVSNKYFDCSIAALCYYSQKVCYFSKNFTERDNVFLAKTQRRKEIIFNSIFLIREIRQNS